MRDVGIYRISGLSAEIQRLKKGFERSELVHLLLFIHGFLFFFCLPTNRQQSSWGTGQGDWCERLDRAPEAVLPRASRSPLHGFVIPQFSERNEWVFSSLWFLMLILFFIHCNRFVWSWGQREVHVVFAHAASWTQQSDGPLLTGPSSQVGSNKWIM